MNTREIIKKYDFKIQKKYGQNFLTDDNILEGIADASGIDRGDTVLEIGPGIGSLTRLLCERADRVIAVEIDRMLIPILEEELKEYNNLTIVNNDILKTDISEFAGDNKRIKVVANLPYYITTPIIMELLEKYDIFDSITVMVQKEVAERMQEGVGTKSYGALSLAVQYYSRPEIVLHVSKNCFLPKPDVDSAVIRLDIYPPEERPVKVNDSEKMFKLIRAAFNQRRKTLVNAVSNAGNLEYSKNEIAEALKEIDKPETIRGEALTLQEFARLSDILG